MAITQEQKDQLKRMCPAAQAVDLGQLIEDAEAGGLTAGDGIDITDGVATAVADDATVEVDAMDGIRVKAGGVDTDQLADEAVTAAKLDPAVVSGIVPNALASGAAGERVIRGQVTLAPANPTTVQIASGSNNASLLGSEAGPFGLTVGNTFIVNPNGLGEQTWTVAGTAGTSVGGNGAFTDMTGQPDNKFRLKVDDDAEWTEVQCNWAGCNSGALIAAQVEAAIQALGGNKAGVTVAFDEVNGKYTITSGDFGTGSQVLIENALDHDCVDELRLSYQGENAGTGDAVLLSKATAEEVEAKIAALDTSLANTVAEGDAVRLNATGSGGASSLVVGNGTENTELGFTNTQADYGDVGLSLGHAMADANYTVVITPITNAPANVDVLAVHNKQAGSFDIYAETPAAIPVEVLVIGTVAA